MTNANQAKRRRPTRAVSAARRGDRHAIKNPIIARVPPDLRTWFDQLASETGRNLSDLATEALAEYRARHTEQEPTP